MLLLLLLLLSSQVFWQRATSDSDLINSEVGLTAKHQASGPLGLPDDAAEEMGGWEKGFGVGWQLIHFAAACALSVGVNFDEQQEDGQIDRQTASQRGRQADRR